MHGIKRDLDFGTQQQLNGLYLIECLAQNLNATFLRQGRFENPHLIWSTAFIQAYFATSSLCSYKWQVFAETGQLVPWSLETEKDLAPTNNMREMLKFCYSILGPNSPNFFREILTKRLQDINNPYTVLSTRSLIVSTENYQANFQNRIRQIFERQDLEQDEHALLLYKILRFIYSIRENIFCGLSLISTPMDEYMPARFRIYSEVLLAVCELLFTTVESISNWQREPGNVFTKSPYSIAGRAIEESLLRNTRRSAILSKRPDHH